MIEFQIYWILHFFRATEPRICSISPTTHFFEYSNLGLFEFHYLFEFLFEYVIRTYVGIPKFMTCEDLVTVIHILGR